MIQQRSVKISCLGKHHVSSVCSNYSRLLNELMWSAVEENLFHLIFSFLSQLDTEQWLQGFLQPHKLTLRYWSCLIVFRMCCCLQSFCSFHLNLISTMSLKMNLWVIKYCSQIFHTRPPGTINHLIKLQLAEVARGRHKNLISFRNLYSALHPAMHFN